MGKKTPKKGMDNLSFLWRHNFYFWHNLGFVLKSPLMWIKIIGEKVWGLLGSFGQPK